MMSLARKTIWTLGALTGAMLAAGVATVWGLLTLQNLSGVTREEFDELREVRPIERQLWDASLHLAEGSREAAVRELSSAVERLEDFERLQRLGESRLDSHHASREEESAQAAIQALAKLRDAIAAAGAGSSSASAEETRALAAAHQHLGELVDEMEMAVARVHLRTADRFRAALIALVSVHLGAATLALVINLLHYRAVIKPLRYVRDGVRKLARGALSTRLEPRGDAEFNDLQRDFNAMAEELEALYRDLEKRVAEQGKRLAVSERLASVGFLAAGVAHEINNPLAIMSGHAESLLRRLREPAPSQAAVGDVVRDLEIIRDEAFRAKNITRQLLELSSGGDPARAPVSLWRVVEGVADLLRGLPQRAGVSVELRGRKDDPLIFRGAEAEIKQVVLNLTMNAIQAVEPKHGRVELRAARENGWVELSVCDDGCGMTTETIEHVFEPFFTGRKSVGGVGLGLAISHAIVRRHQGEIIAESNGLDRGSTFTMRLPAEPEDAA